MSRRPAIVTQADVARVIRAAKREGASEVEVCPNGSIVIRLGHMKQAARQGEIEDGREVIL